MEVTADPIPEGSSYVRVFLDDHSYSSGPIDLVAILAPVGPSHGEVWGASGRLTKDAQILLGLKAYELGFKQLDFCVISGTKVTRYADYVRSDNHFDYYTIDLAARVDEHNQGIQRACQSSTGKPH